MQILTALILLFSTTVFAKQKPGSLVGVPGIEASFSGALSSTPNNIGATSMGVVEDQIAGNFLVSPDPASLWFAGFQTKYTRLSNPEQLTQNGYQVPQGLWDIEASGANIRKFDDGRSLIVRASLGSASDIPFNSIRETALTALGAYRVPISDSPETKTTIQYSLAFSTNSDFLNGIPIPGVGYEIFWKASSSRLVIGLPYIVANITPQALWSANLVATPGSFFVDIDYTPLTNFQLFTSFAFDPQNWLTVNRDDPSYRLIFSKSETGAGSRIDFAPHLKLTVFGGYSFAQRLIEGTSIYSTPQGNLEIQPNWLIRAGLSYAFK